jgi:hypothetical protein
MAEFARPRRDRIFGFALRAIQVALRLCAAYYYYGVGGGLWLVSEACKVDVLGEGGAAEMLRSGNRQMEAVFRLIRG